MRPGRKFVYWAGGVAFKFARLLFVRKDPLAAERVGKKLGHFVQFIAKKQRTRCASNLKLIFPELTDVERSDLAKRCFEHFGILIADFLRADIRPVEEVVESVKSIEGRHYAEVAQASGKGALVMTAHFGNWERAAAYSSSQGFPLTVVQRDANDEALNEIMSDLRRASGVEILSRGNAGIGIMRALRSGKLVAILADQNASECFIEFFGLQTGSVLGPALLSQKSGSPMIPNYCIRTGPNEYRIVVHEPIWPTGTDNESAAQMMHKLNASLESIIREYPEQWLWFHDRWKSARKRGLVSEP